MPSLEIGIIVGSSRPGSLNQSLARALARLAHPDLRPAWLRIDDLPLFDQAILDRGEAPEAVRRLRGQIEACDGLLILTPEHNRSISAVLKNAIDWASRPYGASAWAGKPAAIAGASYGRIGTAAAQQHLRSILGCLDVATMGQPEAFIHLVPGLISADGAISDPQTQAFLQTYMDQFHRWVLRHAAGERTRS